VPDPALKPCPFCGGAAEFVYTPWDEATQTGDDGTGSVVCQTCNAQVFGDSTGGALEWWNRRARDPEAEADRAKVSALLAEWPVIMAEHQEIRQASDALRDRLAEAEQDRNEAVRDRAALRCTLDAARARR